MWSTVAHLPDSQARDPRFESTLLPFRSLGNFVLSAMPQFIQLWKLVPSYRRWWKYEWIVFAWLEWLPQKSSWCQTEQVCQGVKCKALWTVKRTGYMHYIKHTFAFIKNNKVCLVRQWMLLTASCYGCVHHSLTNLLNHLRTALCIRSPPEFVLVVDCCNSF